MGKLIDLFPSKVKPIEQLTVDERVAECINNVKSKGICTCKICKDKVKLIQKLYDVSRWICFDYYEKTGLELSYYDWFQITKTVAALSEEIVFPSK